MTQADDTQTRPVPFKPGWRDYFSRKMLICISLGFTAGLPLFTLTNLMAAWLKTEGVDLKAIGLFALVLFPYNWKFLWSPLLDRFALPLLGRRRGWMLVTQVALMLIIASLGQLSPRNGLVEIVWLCCAIAFVSASHDIVFDAYRREILSDDQQAPGNLLYVTTYKFAALVPGSLSLIVSDHFSWGVVFVFTALFMVPGILTTIFASEPQQYGAPPKNISEAVILPFKEFFQRKGTRQALVVLCFIFLYMLGFSMASALQTPFFLDLGFTRTQIGVVAKTSSLWATLAGGMIGAVWLVKTGVNRGLWIFGFCQAVSILGFALLAKTGGSLWMLGVVMFADYFAYSLASAAMTAYMAMMTDMRYTATQFALFSSLALVPRTFASAASGYLQQSVGWFGYFVACFVLALPGLLMLFRIAPWRTLSQPRVESSP